MRRATLPFLAALLVVALAPASALARHHSHRHHSRAHHARIKRFGRDVGSSSTGAGSADNAGTVQSFSGGILTIALGNPSSGNTVSGMVTPDTEMECTAPAGPNTIHEDGDGGSGDQSGDGNTSGSDDNQAQGSGDDQAGDQGDAAEQNDNQAEDQNDNQAEDQNENQAEDQNEAEDQAEGNCTAANLAPGTIVHEAELRISGAGNTWRKVELGS